MNLIVLLAALAVIFVLFGASPLAAVLVFVVALIAGLYLPARVQRQ